RGVSRREIQFAHPRNFTFAPAPTADARGIVIERVEIIGEWRYRSAHGFGTRRGDNRGIKERTRAIVFLRPCRKRKQNGKNNKCDPKTHAIPATWTLSLSFGRSRRKL